MDGKTPLMLACVHDDDGKSVEYLLNHKADPCIVDNKVSKKMKKIIVYSLILEGIYSMQVIFTVQFFVLGMVQKLVNFLDMFCTILL